MSIFCGRHRLFVSLCASESILRRQTDCFRLRRTDDAVWIQDSEHHEHEGRVLAHRRHQGLCKSFRQLVPRSPPASHQRNRQRKPGLPHSKIADGTRDCRRDSGFDRCECHRAAPRSCFLRRPGSVAEDGNQTSERAQRSVQRNGPAQGHQGDHQSATAERSKALQGQQSESMALSSSTLRKGKPTICGRTSNQENVQTIHKGILLFLPTVRASYRFCNGWVGPSPRNGYTKKFTNLCSVT